jgi:hypothetical protein
LGDIYQALARTALLIDLDVFGPGADHHRIIDGLRATTARIITDRANVGSPAGQTALVTLYAQLAMLGLQIDLDIPGAPLLVPQPPLHAGDLHASSGTPPSQTCSTSRPTCSPGTGTQARNESSAPSRTR